VIRAYTLHTLVVYSRAADTTMTVVDGVSRRERMTPLLYHVKINQ